VEEPYQYVVGVRPFAFTNKIQKKTKTRVSSFDRMFKDWMVDTVHMLVSMDKFIIKLISEIISEKVGLFPLPPRKSRPNQIGDK
jgi:hypothetical protein